MHIMLDLETMGTNADSAIVAIGAVRFDRHGLTPAESDGHFYRNVNLQSAVDCGGVINPKTVAWWMKQGEEARKKLDLEAGQDIRTVLMDFDAWVKEDEDLHGVWGNGAAFDNVILSQAYKRQRWDTPWEFWQDRCYRTVKNMVDMAIPAFEGTPHNALHDALHQAKHLINIERQIRGTHGTAWVGFL